MVRLVRILKLIFSPLCHFYAEIKWQQQLSYWEKRVSRLIFGLINAQPIITKTMKLNQHVLSTRHSKIMAFQIKLKSQKHPQKTPLEVEIAEKMSSHQVMQSQTRAVQKNVVSKAVESAKGGRGFSMPGARYMRLNKCPQSCWLLVRARELTCKLILSPKT